MGYRYKTYIPPLFKLVTIHKANTVFSRIEAAASIKILSKSAASMWGRLLFTVFSVIIPGSLIWYQLCNEYAKCHCSEINLLHQTGFYLPLFSSKLRLVYEGGFYSRKYGNWSLRQKIATKESQRVYFWLYKKEYYI